MPYRLALAIIAVLALAASGCSSDDTETDTGESTDTEETTDAEAEEGAEDADADADADSEEGASAAVSVTGAWGRASPMMADAGAAYMVLTSEEGDKLVSASVDASVAAVVEIHETVPVDDAEGDMEDMGSEDEEATDEEATDEEATDEEATDEEATDEEATDEEATDEEGDAPMDMAMTMRELPDGLELPAGEAVNLEPGGYHIMLLQLAEPLVAGETFDLTLNFETAGTQVVTVEILENAP
jgi:copper(I)-binding protein